MSLDFVFLASGSPRRRQLLVQIGVPFRVLGVSVDESVLPGEQPPAYTSRLAAAKAAAGRAHCTTAALTERPVLAADTAVVMGGEILGKPQGPEDGIRMLRLLSGRTHEVVTSVALAMAGRTEVRVSRSEVSFRGITNAEAREYLRTGEGEDKAGAYAIQGLGAVFVERLSGSFSGVMGLPLYETAELLDLAGVPRWRADAGER